MKNHFEKTALASLATVSLLGSSPLVAAELLNSSYDIARELFVALNPSFENNGMKPTLTTNSRLNNHTPAHQSKLWLFYKG